MNRNRPFSLDEIKKIVYNTPGFFTCSTDECKQTIIDTESLKEYVWGNFKDNSFINVTDIAVSLKDHSKLQQVSENYTQSKFENKTSVLTWKDFGANYINVVELRKRMINVLSIFILLIAAVGIINTMLMSMVERKREIGNLMALGVRRNQIVRLFLIEGGLLGFFGGLVAAFIGSIILYYGQTVGIPMDMSKLGDVPIAGRLYFYLNFLDVLRYFLLGTGIAALATLYPAIKTSRLEPAVALRGDRG